MIALGACAVSALLPARQERLCVCDRRRQPAFENTRKQFRRSLPRQGKPEQTAERADQAFLIAPAGGDKQDVEACGDEADRRQSRRHLEQPRQLRCDVRRSAPHRLVPVAPRDALGAFRQHRAIASRQGVEVGTDALHTFAQFIGILQHAGRDGAPDNAKTDYEPLPAFCAIEAPVRVLPPAHEIDVRT